MSEGLQKLIFHFGTKIGNLVHYLVTLFHRDSSARIIVFSNVSFLTYASFGFANPLSVSTAITFYSYLKSSSLAVSARPSSESTLIFLY